jgi:hypothetical protein
VVEDGHTPNDVRQGGGADVVLAKGTPAHRWVLTEKAMLNKVGKNNGYWTTNKDLAELQAEMFRGQWLHVRWVQLMDKNNLAQFQREDLDRLLAIVDRWQTTLDMYNGTSKGLDPKTMKPSA